jgi:hypothetical protein
VLGHDLPAQVQGHWFYLNLILDLFSRARYCTGYLSNIGVPADPNPMDFSGWGKQTGADSPDPQVVVMLSAKPLM